MVDTHLPTPDKELRYRDVSIHSQGKTEHGTLYLLKHHVCFSFYPGAKKESRSTTHSRNVSGAQSLATDHPAPSKDSAASDGHANTAAHDAISSEGMVAHAEGPSKAGHHKARPKDIWIPYPMIGYCLLRPSNAASMMARQQPIAHSESSHQDGDELFPPTFGTSGFERPERPSTDSSRLAPYSTPPRPSSPVRAYEPAAAYDSARQPVIRMRRKDFQMMALHFNSGSSDMSADEAARQAFHVLRKRCCINKIEALHAFQYQPHKDETRATPIYDARREYARMGVGPKAAEGPGAAWRITDINQNYAYSPTYPNVLCVPNAVSDNLLKYGGAFRSRSRIPCLTYLHSNGGSITRSSQPKVGVQNKRNPQDERLVSAIFSSHTPPLPFTQDSPTDVAAPTSESSGSDEPVAHSRQSGEASTLRNSQSDTALDENFNEKPAAPRVYGSTRQNLIADARPLKNVIANRVTGGGIEDVANYSSGSHTPVERVFLNIANIHVMRKSLEKVIDSFGSADYVNMRPNQETLRKSGWLGHIAGLLEGSEMVARVVGLGGSHVLVHCSDGWDRTAQVAALAQIMMDPHYRTLDGFISLVQKDFLSFGHKFRDRDGIEGYDDWFKIENERIAPSRTRENAQSDPSSLNAMGQKAFAGAKSWFERNKGNFFNQQNNSGTSLGEGGGSHSSSPPPNPVIHAPPASTSNDDDEHKRSEGEISPVFHQFLDTVFQLLHQNANAFEFNERFLKRLFYQVYACQYGEFLFNTEKDRSQHKLPSVWGHFLSRRQEFTNPEYVAKVDDPLIFPRRKGLAREVEVRWWASLFGRKDEEMNLPVALAPADPAPHTAPLRPSVSFEKPAAEECEGTPDATLKETRSTPSFAAMRDSLTNSFSTMAFGAPGGKKEPASEPVASRAGPAMTAEVAHEQIEERGKDSVSNESSETSTTTAKFDQMSMDEGDPLGVSSSAPKSVGSGGGGLDFAAFASQNAFRDR